ncbi:MAG TPA: cob(I)yrinic acid a,c-diamide adenosyltransferase [Opitutaceae bacterium]|nr:cob(I)yrinic acid a,c-diamide adenosyltransferase [Opitutaceae bacterium]
MAHSIATRTGDDGSTSLLYGQRVPKDHPQVEALGAFDELNAAIGFAKAHCPLPTRRTELEQYQKDLVALMGELACAESDAEKYLQSKFAKIGETELARADAGVAELEAKGLKFDGWATPGANPYSAALDVARTVARRAERRLVALPSQGRTVRPIVGQFVNRLSDLFWLLAREAEQ